METKLERFIDKGFWNVDQKVKQSFYFLLIDLCRIYNLYIQPFVNVHNKMYKIQ